MTRSLPPASKWVAPLSRAPLSAPLSLPPSGWHLSPLSAPLSLPPSGWHLSRSQVGGTSLAHLSRWWHLSRSPGGTSLAPSLPPSGWHLSPGTFLRPPPVGRHWAGRASGLPRRPADCQARCRWVGLTCRTVGAAGVDAGIQTGLKPWLSRLADV